eukprot:TRINITY_DN16174_c0_g1_i1.p1 TRINITY_DN16174_c0_g1~~TRINITY_DN16174_c0_g1_i1.p1  ORF type:complete len:573 (-),score=122.94 TRINITY_DN16174_c0_g1_i1:216-1910(-)
MAKAGSCQAWLKKRPWMLGFIVPAATLVFLLLTDAFNLRSQFSSPAPRIDVLDLQDGGPSASVSEDGASKKSSSTAKGKNAKNKKKEKKKKDEAKGKKAKPTEDQTRASETPAATASSPSPSTSPRPPLPTCSTDKVKNFYKLRRKLEKSAWAKPAEKGELLGLLKSYEKTDGVPAAIRDLVGKDLTRKVGAAIAVHPPKFYAVAQLLMDWMSCRAAFQAISVYLVFISEKDLAMFREAQQCVTPGLAELWTPVISKTPTMGWMKSAGVGNQYVAAYKKWYGIAAIMDFGVKEEYGLMLDSEVTIYDLHIRARTGKACGPGGGFDRLYDRIRRMEAGKAWPAARVSNNLTTYNFGSFTKSGRDYDLALIRENINFLYKGKSINPCNTEVCNKVKYQMNNVLWSWWTDLPWLNLAVAKRMIAAMVNQKVEDIQDWRAAARTLRFPRFEYVCYQQWSVLHEGFRFRDVTDTTMEAKWGSYLEDPQQGSHLTELNPMWASAETVWRSEDKQISALSTQAPPLLIFHTDHENQRYTHGGHDYKEMWEKLIVELLKVQGRKDWDANTIH